MKKICILFLMSLLMLTSVSLKAQCRYCKTYEDYVAGRWQSLDTIYFDQHSKSHQVWWGGSDFTLKTGDKALDKMLKKEVFAVMQADTIYVNCRNLRYEKARFGNGYSRAIRMGQNDLLFVNRKIGRKEQMNAGAMAGVFGVLGGAIGGGIAGGMIASDMLKNQVCYVVSGGADKKGHIILQLMDDEEMHEIVKDRDDLHQLYWNEKDESKRRAASNVLPILEKAGLIHLDDSKGF